MWFITEHKNEPFIFVKNLFTDIDIHKIHVLGEKSEVGKSMILEGNISPIRKSKNSWITSTKDSEWLYRKITDAIILVNNNFFNYDLVAFGDLQYTVYDSEENGYYMAHTDYGFDNMTNRKLSFTIQLDDSKDYDGGELILYNTKQGICPPNQKGTIIFFPSYMLHEVKSVTRGVRRSLVGWILGPKFK